MNDIPPQVRKIADEILNLISEDTHDEEGGRQQTQKRAMALFFLGMIEGRLTAIVPGADSVTKGQVWRKTLTPEDRVTVLQVTSGGLVTYKYCDCMCTLLGHTLTDHVTSSRVSTFKDLFEPVDGVDPLIEQWQRIVDSV